jgi:hypothetical protein
MCIVMLEYNKDVQTHRELRDAVLEHSRKSMSNVIARYL